MKKEVVYTMPYVTDRDKAEVQKLRSTLYEKYDSVSLYHNGVHEMRVVAEDKVPTCACGRIKREDEDTCGGSICIDDIPF